MKLLLSAFLFLFGEMVFAQGNLPECPGHGARWSNCVSTTTYQNGDRYAVEYFLDKRTGKGAIFYANGKKYVGEIGINGIPNGKGTLTFPNGDKYEGNFISGAFDGEGTFTYANRSPSRRGIWKNNDLIISECSGSNLIFWKNCFGTYVYDNGSEYIGEFKNGSPSGTGTLTSPNGNKYVGQWLNGVRHGIGVQTYTDNRQTQDGIWANGDFSNGRASVSNDGYVTLNSQSQQNIDTKLL